MRPELAKSEYLEDNFDHWGNRCYLFSAECPGYYTIQKGGFYFQNYEIDTERLRELGGTYLLSAAYIDHSGNTGLEPVREEAFETEDSYYRIHSTDDSFRRRNRESNRHRDNSFCARIYFSIVTIQNPISKTDYISSHVRWWCCRRVPDRLPSPPAE